MDSNPFSQFFEYIGSVFEHGEPLLGIVVFWIATFHPRVQHYVDHHKNRRFIWLAIISVCVFFSGFFTWKAEHDRYMSAVFRLDVPTVTIQGGTTYQVLPDDYLLSVASTPDKKTTIKLPPDPHRGQRFEIKDANGAAEILNVVIDGNGHKIDQKDTTELYTPFAAKTVTFNGIQWIIT